MTHADLQNKINELNTEITNLGFSTIEYDYNTALTAYTTSVSDLENKRSVWQTAKIKKEMMEEEISELQNEIAELASTPDVTTITINEIICEAPADDAGNIVCASSNEAKVGETLTVTFSSNNDITVSQFYLEFTPPSTTTPIRRDLTPSVTTGQSFEGSYSIQDASIDPPTSSIKVTVIATDASGNTITQEQMSNITIGS